MLKKLTIRTICEYCNESKKTSNYFKNLYVSIAVDVKKTNNYLQDLYCNGCKQINYYLQNLYVGIAYLKWPYENYNRKDVGIARCSL
jgi:hypothetical protein